MTRSSMSGITKPWLITTVLWFLSVSLFVWLNLRMGTTHTICPLKTLTDLPCPACGGTRALLALAKGQLSAAFFFNPLATAFLLLSPFLLLFHRWNRRQTAARTWTAGKAFWIILTALILANWWYVIKNLP